MSAHPLTVKARSLLSQTAVLDIELLETLTRIIKDNVHRAEACDDPRTYCVKRLGMSDDSAYRRLYSADLLDRYPDLVRPLIESRAIHLTGLAFLHRVITDENAAELLHEARGKTKAEIEEIVCRVKPRPPVTASVKRVAAKQISKNQALPLVLNSAVQSSSEKEDAPVQSSKAAADSGNAEPVTPATTTAPADPFTHKFVCMMTEETKHQLDAARDLMPEADLNDLFAKAVTMLVERTMMKKRRVLKHTRSEVVSREREAEAATNVEALIAAEIADENRTGAKQAEQPIAVGPTGYQRFATADIARIVFVRDNNECQYRDDYGNQCCSRRYLQLHHLLAWAKGGSTTAANLKVYCRSHNLYQAELDFGPRDAA